MFSRVPARSLVASLFAIFLLSAAAQAKGSSNAAFPNVRIKNFGQMDERFFRGAEPKDVEDFQALKALGINTVIDLQEKPERTERANVESLGMRRSEEHTSELQSRQYLVCRLLLEK